jgi:hypothetical protein
MEGLGTLQSQIAEFKNSLGMETADNEVSD